MFFVFNLVWPGGNRFFRSGESLSVSAIDTVVRGAHRLSVHRAACMLCLSCLSITSCSLFPERVGAPETPSKTADGFGIRHARNQRWPGLEALLDAARGGSAQLSGITLPSDGTELSRQPDVLEATAAIPAESQAELPLYSLDAINLPLETLFYSLTDQANIGLRLQGEYTQPVTIRAVQQPLVDILDLLAQQQAFRWELNDEQLTVMPDAPFLKTYSVDYLNLTRQVQSSVGLATQVGSISFDSEGSSTSGLANSSQALIQNESQHTFWETLSEGLSTLFVDATDSPPRFSINRDASLVTVIARARQHDEIYQYLTRILDSVKRQVLIEATVVEISLFDQFEAGINWRLLGRAENGIQAAQIFNGAPQLSADVLNQLPSPSAIVGAIHQSNRLGRLSATLNLLGQFGDVKILSRPQIIAINNQSAVLKVVDNRVYFTVKVERRTAEGEQGLNTSTEIHTVPVGLVMSVTPYISADDTVVLNVRPTISRILGFVNDPNPELAAAQVQSGVPEIQVREMESVLSVASGQIAMIGGLMQEQQRATTTEVPLLGRLPLVGKLFSDQKNRGTTTELMVFLQPTVLPAPVVSDGAQ